MIASLHRPVMHDNFPGQWLEHFRDGFLMHGMFFVSFERFLAFKADDESDIITAVHDGPCARQRFAHAHREDARNLGREALGGSDDLRALLRIVFVFQPKENNVADIARFGRRLKAGARDEECRRKNDEVCKDLFGKLHGASSMITVQPLSICIFVVGVAMFVRAAEPAADSAPVPQAFDRLTFHAQPQALNKNARISDWPRFLGPNDDATSPETHLLHEFPKAGPTLVWELKKGESYTSPAIVDGMVVIFHALDGKETIEALEAETGRRFWVCDYPINYKDRYGFANGPRGSPVIAGGRVVTLGVTCMMTCIDLKTGRVAWQRDLRKEFNVPQDFFGHGGSPLIMDGKVIVNVGGKDEPVPDDDSRERAAALAKPGLCVGAFDLKTGALVWSVKDEWGASYASPVRANIHGRDVALIFAGGESNPATGGLLCVDPKDGMVLSRHPWRAKDYIQAVGSSPVAVPGKNRAFISTAYPKGRPLGGVMLEFGKDFKTIEVWKSGKFATHWMNPVLQDGFLYGIDGETEQAAQLVCFDSDNGTEKWRKDLTWDDEEMTAKNGGRVAKSGILRASLLRADGKTLCLGETGALLWLDLTPEGAKIESRAQLFYSPHTWCLPALSHGLLYVMQNEREMVRDSGGLRILCYDLRKP